MIRMFPLPPLNIFDIASGIPSEISARVSTSSRRFDIGERLPDRDAIAEGTW
jgi:hypothetical protein